MTHQSKPFHTPRRKTLIVLWTLIAIMALILSACGSGSRAASSGAAPGTPVGTPQPTFTAKLNFNPPKAKAGDTVAFAGSDYTPGASVDLVWHTVNGHFELQGGTEFQGERFDEITQVLLTTTADAHGAISGSFRVPVDFGGAHDVRGRVGDKEISQASVTITPTFSMTPSAGPIGTPIELRITGVDWRANVNTWHVLYNNTYLGFMSAVTTRGIAVANFRAAGPVGTANISVWHNSFNPTPYLNFQDGPYKDVPVAEFSFNVSSDPGSLGEQVENVSATDNPAPVANPGPGKLSLSVDRGPVGTPMTLRGANLPANATLGLRWWTMVGNRVSAIGFSEQSVDLGTVQTDAKGTFSKTIPIPNDLGGNHRIEVVNGDTVLAAAGMITQPSVVSVTPTQVKAGDHIQIHLQGLGWTTYENTYAVTYDNSYIGYVCGFSTGGDVTFNVTATGGPGTHIIDLYPTIYKGADAQPRIYSIPQLTYQTDHPQRTTPAIRLSIQITD